MKLILTLFLVFCVHRVSAEPEQLSSAEAFLAASLAALKTPPMKEAPIQVRGSIREASGLQEDYGAKAMVAIPDKGAASLDLAKLTPELTPLCRLWLKSYALKVPDASKAEHKEVEAAGEKHRVTVWLLAVRKAAKGGVELALCANQKEPLLVTPLTALAKPEKGHPDVPVQIQWSAENGSPKLQIKVLGTHTVRLPLAAK